MRPQSINIVTTSRPRHSVQTNLEELLPFPNHPYAVLFTANASLSWLNNPRHSFLLVLLDKAFFFAHLPAFPLGTQPGQLDPTHAILVAQALLQHEIVQAWNTYWPLELRRWRHAIYHMRLRHINGSTKPCDELRRLPPTTPLSAHLILLSACNPRSLVITNATSAYNRWSRLNNLDNYATQFLNMAVPH